MKTWIKPQTINRNNRENEKAKKRANIANEEKHVRLNLLIDAQYRKVKRCHSRLPRPAKEKKKKKKKKIDKSISVQHGHKQTNKHTQHTQTSWKR